MPVKPPYDLLSEGANAQKTYPLLGFSQAYDGTPVYKFDLNGNYSYENLNIETLKRIWYENVRQIASAYQKNGNVFRSMLLEISMPILYWQALRRMQ